MSSQPGTSGSGDGYREEDEEGEEEKLSSCVSELAIQMGEMREKTKKSASQTDILTVCCFTVIPTWPFVKTKWFFYLDNFTKKRG